MTKNQSSDIKWVEKYRGHDIYRRVSGKYYTIDYSGIALRTIDVAKRVIDTYLNAMYERSVR